MILISFANKYRPATFKDVVGQDHITTILTNIIKNKSTHQVFILTGAKGLGKTSNARIFSKMLNCENPNESLEPCLECEGCKDNLSIIELDAATHSGKDDIKKIQEMVMYKTKSKYRVVILDECHLLTIQSWSVLLKLLEEPPEHVIFVMCTTEFHKIPATIISRSITLKYKNITTEDLSKRLKYIAEQENVLIDELSLNAISEYANGGMRDAITTLEQLAIFTNNNITYDDVLTFLGTPDTKKVYDIIEYIKKNDILSYMQTINNFENLNLETFLNLFSKTLSQMLIDKSDIFEKRQLMNFINITIKYYDYIKYVSDRNSILISFFYELNKSEANEIIQLRKRLSEIEDQLTDGTIKTTSVNDIKNSIKQDIQEEKTNIKEVNEQIMLFVHNTKCKII